MKYVPSFIKIGGAVSEKNGRIGQTFVVLYIGLGKVISKLPLFLKSVIGRKTQYCHLPI